jgi:hypothetical protein
MTLAQIVTKTVNLEPNWEEDDMAGFKKYLQKVYDTNVAISDLFEDENLRVDTMKLTMEVSLTPRDKSLVADIPLSPAAALLDLINSVSDTPEVNEALSPINQLD